MLSDQNKILKYSYENGQFSKLYKKILILSYLTQKTSLVTVLFFCKAAADSLLIDLNAWTLILSTMHTNILL